MKSLLSIENLDTQSIQDLIDLSLKLFKNPEPLLAGKNICFAFEKPSLRTKVGTEVAINKLGGSVLHVEAANFFGARGADSADCRESLIDTVKNVSEWCDGIFARVFDHQTLVQLDKHGSIPVVNALCDLHHPMQALADFITIQEAFGREARPTITFVGDANNVAYSLIEAGLKLGYPMRFCGPSDYFWNEDHLTYFNTLAAKHKITFESGTKTEQIIPGSDVIYTDTFVSMGEESVYETKTKAFADYQVNANLIKMSGTAPKFMHCLPAHRNIEVTDEVIDSPDSLVYNQARNRMVSSLGVFATLCA